MKYLIANLVTEYEPRYESLKKLTQPFIYEGEKEADSVIGVNDARIRSLLSEMTQDSDIDDAEGFGRRKIHTYAVMAQSVRRQGPYHER